MAKYSHSAKDAGYSAPSSEHALFTNAPIGITITTPEGRLLSANPAMAGMFGYDSPDELIESAKGNITQLYADPADREELIRLLRQNEEVLNYECWGIQRDGSMIWVSISVSAVRDDNSEIIHFQGFITDITERKQLQDSLSKNERFLDAVLESVQDGISIVDPDLTIRRVNEVIRQWYAQNLPLEGKKCYSAYHNANAPCLHCPTQRSFQSGRTEYKEVSGLPGSLAQWMEIFSYPMRNEAGQVGYVVEFVRDITERKQMEKQVHELNLFQRSILDNLPYNIAVLDKQGNIIYVNNYWKKFAEENGLSPNKVSEGSNYISVCLSATGKDSDLALSFVEGLYEVISGEREFYSLEYPCHSPERQRWFVGQITPFLEDPPRRVAVGHANITEQKKVEEKLKQMSFQDSLTGLYNRNFFEEEMTRLSDSRYSPLGIIVCDLDGMKLINDTLGHQAGDRMLINAANILRQSFRSSDIVARIGGDEFAVLLPQTGPEKVERMLQRLRGAVRKYNNYEPELPLALSIGYAASATTGDLHALFREADNLMYREKIQQEGSQRNAILQALTKTMQARDFDTEGHCERLQELGVSLARSLGYSREVVNDMSLLARFHDLGKMEISDSILFKQGTLTEEEKQQMRQHCEIGHRIASSIPDLLPIADHILKHHEWWDGGGYPLGLSGKDIPLPSRILAIVDAYDAMTSDRPYRLAMTSEKAIAELKRCAGTQFDPDLVEKFIQILQESDPE